MVKFVLPRAAGDARHTKILPRANHGATYIRAARGRWASGAIKILGKCVLLQFDENSHRIRVELGKNTHEIANDSFKTVG
jgi:hypothetical protein